jgi:hypothetical protein
VNNGARVCVADINKDAARAVGGEFGTSAIGVADARNATSVATFLASTGSDYLTGRPSLSRYGANLTLRAMRPQADNGRSSKACLAPHYI